MNATNYDLDDPYPTLETHPHNLGEARLAWERRQKYQELTPFEAMDGVTMNNETKELFGNIESPFPFAALDPLDSISEILAILGAKMYRVPVDASEPDFRQEPWPLLQWAPSGDKAVFVIKDGKTGNLWEDGTEFKPSEKYQQPTPGTIEPEACADGCCTVLRPSGPKTPVFETFRGNPKIDQFIELLPKCIKHPTNEVSEGTIYISGPMRGFPDFNFPAFDKARDFYLDAGFSVISPADVERAIDGPDAHALPENPKQHAYAARDIVAIFYFADHVVVLPGWEKSTGARAEVALAHWLKVPVQEFQTGNRIEPGDVTLTVKQAAEAVSVLTGEKAESILLEAQRLVYGDRGEDYGHPLDDFTRAANIWQVILGVPVTAEQVGLCMVGVKLAREINRPKRDNRVDMAGYALCVDRCVSERKRRDSNGEANKG